MACPPTQLFTSGHLSWRPFWVFLISLRKFGRKHYLWSEKLVSSYHPIRSEGSWAEFLFPSRVSELPSLHQVKLMMKKWQIWSFVLVLIWFPYFLPDENISTVYCLQCKHHISYSIKIIYYSSNYIHFTIWLRWIYRKHLTKWEMWSSALTWSCAETVLPGSLTTYEPGLPVGSLLTLRATVFKKSSLTNSNHLHNKRLLLCVGGDLSKINMKLARA